MSYILVTGGAGYIGSHTVVELVQHGFKVVVVDNLVNSSYDAVARIEYIVQQKVPFFQVDIADFEGLSEVFARFPISGVIHFAALKAVGESTKIPLEYYENNVGGTINLLKVMGKFGVRTIVFSSSATVYGDATRFENMIPIPEHCPNDPTNPYGKTKFVIENILKDIYTSDPQWKTAILRYFNPIGAHPSGLIGEDPLGIPNNLLPYLAQVAIGRREKLSVFGNDYESHDGTPIRDYIHVVDLARGHIAALKYLKNIEGDGLFREWNLGTGKGLTVFDVFHAFCRAVGRELPYEVVGRRSGDVVNLTANPTRANTELKWKTELSIDDACRDLWKWTTENPFGYQVENYLWEKFGDGKDEKDFESRKHTVKLGELEVSLLNYGASIQSVNWKGHNLACGYKTLLEYKRKDNPYFGATIGRVANRIDSGSFQIGKEEFQLALNEGNVTALHGGVDGFDKNLFLGPVVKSTGKSVFLDFVFVEKDGQNGYPADLVTNVRFIVTENSLAIEFLAEIPESSKNSATPVNLTNHSYFTVSDAPTVEGTVVRTATNEYLDVDEQLIPTEEFGKFSEKLLTGLTLTSEDKFDHCLVLEKEKFQLDTRNLPEKFAFEAKNPKTHIGIQLSTTEPTFQFYTGDGVSTPGFEPRCGFAIEAARYVDAINHAKWESQVLLHKGETYGSRLTYTFS